jgi:hypothetical protein
VAINDCQLVETVTLSQAKALIQCAAHEQSFLLLSPPGVGKSDMIREAAAEAGLECRSLLGTQIAPEDVSGVPHVIGERSVFCPPRVLLPENTEPFCLFLDELPSCTPDVQKAFYALLLERRIGEHSLPKGTWVVAAGNRIEDRALVRTISSALINRVVLLQIRVDVQEWLAWAARNAIRGEIVSCIEEKPESLLRDTPRSAEPFSTPRAWSSLSRAMDLAEQAGVLDSGVMESLAHGRLSTDDATSVCTTWQMARALCGRYTFSQVRELLKESVARLELPPHLIDNLSLEGVYSIGQLARMNEYQLRSFRDFDEARIRDVQEALARFGLTLGMSFV